jgi:hypothetical protein
LKTTKESEANRSDLFTHFLHELARIDQIKIGKIAKKIFLGFALTIFCAGFGNAQTTQAQDDDDVQSWNDLSLTVPMTKHFDFFMMATARFGKNVSQTSDTRFAVGYVWKPTKSFSVTSFYWRVDARNARGQFRAENQLNLRGVYRFPFAYKGFGLAHRSQYEYRVRRPQNSWRYRAMMTVDKDIPKNFIQKAKFFVSDEVFYDSIIKKFNRNRFTVGVTKTLTKNLALDVYYMRQNDGYSHPGDLNVIGTAWKVRL